MATILIVDDQLSMRTLLKGILGRTGHNLLFAENGVEALELFETRSIDLLITDINMPKMDGLELLSRLQSERAYPDVPKIVMSAQRPQDIKPRLEGLGVTDLFEKPLDIKRLRQQIDALLTRTQS